MWIRMRLEFEVEESLKNDREIIYNILRKGLKVGFIHLKEPYNENRQFAKTIILEG